MFVERTGAQRLVLYMEAIADATATRQSVISFAEHVDTPYEFPVCFYIDVSNRGGNEKCPLNSMCY